MMNTIQPIVQQIQSSLIEAIKKTSKPISKDKVLLHKGFCNTSNSSLAEAYSHNSIGKKAKALIDLLDFNHPELQAKLPEINKSLEVMVKGVKYYNLSKNSGFMEYVDRKYISKNISSKFIKMIEHPEWDCRFYASSEKRDAVRKKNVSKRIDLKHFLKKNKALLSKNVLIKDYIRFGNSHKSEMDKYQAREQIFNNFGLIALKSAVEKSLSSLKFAAQENHFGFQRMSVCTAVVAACQLLNAKIDANSDLIIDPSFIKGFDAGCNIQHIIQPILHPVHNLNPSDEMKELLSLLDNFPDADNKCIFDNYFVLVPAVKSDIFEHNAKYAFDNKLIKEKRVFPILLGQKEGKCYFISFWN